MTPTPTEPTVAAPPTPPAPAAGTLELVRTTCLLILTVFASAAALMWLRPVVVPFLVALALHYLLTPVSGWLSRRGGFSDGFAVAGAAAVGLIALSAVGFLVWISAVELARGAETYAARIDALSSDPSFAKFVDWAGLPRDSETGRVVVVSPERTRQLVFAAVSWLQSAVADAFLALVFLLFLMLSGKSGPTPATRGLPTEAAERVRRYLAEMFVFSIVTGALVAVILGTLGVTLWLPFGFLAFVLNFIPAVGSLIATVLPIPVVLLDPELSTVSKVLAIALPATVQFLIGNVIQPRIQGRSQNLHPVVPLVALVVFGMLWGPVGAVLAVPTTAVLKIAFERIPGGRPFADLLEGRFEGSTDAEPNR